MGEKDEDEDENQKEEEEVEEMPRAVNSFEELPLEGSSHLSFRKTYPVWHSHLNDPGVLTQVRCSPEQASGKAHSSTSTNNRNDHSTTSE